MKKITTKTKLRLAQQFFELVWNQIEEGTDFIFEELDPECEYGDELCKLFNNDTILEVLQIGFRKKFGEDLKCGKLTSEIEREAKAKSAKDTEVPEIPPRLDVCPKCGADAAVFVHPAFDGGAYVACDKCRYSDQAVTWAPTDAQAAVKWNKMERCLPPCAVFKTLSATQS